MARHLAIRDKALTDVAAGVLDRVMFFEPPRHGKSELGSKYCPAWYLGTYPDRRVMQLGHGDTFAGKWGRAARDILEEHGRAAFGVEISQDTRAGERWNIRGREGGMIAAGVGGAITGEGAHLMLIDDPIKNAEEAVSERFRDNLWDWWQSTASTRLEPGGAVILTQTRWHEDDLAGRLLKTEPDRWKVIRFPAIAEEDEYDDDGQLIRRTGEALWPWRFPIEKLEQRRSEIDAYWWNALYQQRPSQHARAEWPSEYFGDFLWFDTPPPFLLRATALDPSKGKGAAARRGDFSAIVSVGVCANNHLWIDADIERRPIEQIVTDCVHEYERFQPDGFGVESNAFQEMLAGELERVFHERGILTANIMPIFSRLSKEIRIRRIGPWLKERRVHVRKNKGGELLVGQLKDFPLGAHDDGPDALEMCLQVLEGLTETPGDNLGSNLIRGRA